MKKEEFYLDYSDTFKIVGEAIIDEEGYCIKVKMKTHVSRGHYYSFLNELLQKAGELFKFRE